MLIIDTSVLIDALHRKETTIGKIQELEETGETLCTTQINVLELYKGVFTPTKSEDGLKKIRKLLDAFLILPISEDTYEIFGELAAMLRQSGDAIGDFDELIASIALIQGAALVSRDSHFERVPGLKIISF
jgi:predicted nucleic acid-binding protein